MSRYSRHRIMVQAGLGEQIPKEQEGEFPDIEVEQGVRTLLILRRASSFMRSRRLYLVCPTCKAQVLLGLWDRHQHSHTMSKLDTDKEKDDGNQEKESV